MLAARPQDAEPYASAYKFATTPKPARWTLTPAWCARAGVYTLALWVMLIAGTAVFVLALAWIVRTA
jgi:hypothetical protein